MLSLGRDLVLAHAAIRLRRRALVHAEELEYAEEKTGLLRNKGESRSS